jgi:hypothetical protein
MIHNDPRGTVYFYWNSTKKCPYICLHADRKSTIQRKASDEDKKSYLEEWKKFEDEQAKRKTGKAA